MIIGDITIKLTPIFKHYNVVFAYLFGSTAKNELSPSSDIDIAVYLKNGYPQKLFDTLLSIHLDTCRALKANDVDIVVLNANYNLMLIDEIIRNGILLYDADPPLREEFELKMIHAAIDFKTQRFITIGV
ncbi:MAG: nucleotidyltransferase domain-containing protein [Spirochaetes bacterium]|nr:nucleotidyltransferase domain-containing protein [Spirochaetota bacterium]